MKYLTIRVVNFKPYRDVELEFGDTDGHIHIIEGPQGAGKTSLHKAIQWGLYGGEGPRTNYISHWNSNARDENDERMSVRITFEEGSDYFELARTIDDFNHSNNLAREHLSLVVNGQQELVGDDAQARINQILPEQLKQFYFLDGERIRTLIEDRTGRQVKSEIETVLRHQPIINSQNDLNDLLADEYLPERERIEEEASKREELVEDIQNSRTKKRTLKTEKEEKQTRISDIEDRIDEILGKLEQYNVDRLREIENIEADIRELTQKKSRTLDSLKESWGNFHLKILEEELSTARSKLAERENELEQTLKKIRKHEIVHDLVQEAKNGTCPICGNSEFRSTSAEYDDEYLSMDSQTIEQEKLEVSRARQSLTIPDTPTSPPAELKIELDSINQSIREKEEHRQSLMEDVGGIVRKEEPDRLEEDVNSLENELNQLESELSDLSNSIEEISEKIEEKNQMLEEMAGEKELTKIKSKIDTVESAIEYFDKIREQHTREKRDQIRTKMNEVFEKVSRSEFIRSRYERIDFRGDPGDEDSYVLQLINSNGERKDMVNHPPSAGEAQLCALSFIFGLNEYTRYSTTIVFDTVAGRLDLQNSRAQGEFFTTLDDPLILLVTDAELENLGPTIKDSIGTHYKIELDSELNSIFKERVSHEV